MTEEAIAVIGQVEGPAEYVLDGVAGAARLSDGSVVAVVGDASEVRRYDPAGELLWSVGGEGEGPGEYKSPRSPHGCIGDERILVHDWENRRITALDADGQVVAVWPLRRPAASVTCSANGRISFTTDTDADVSGVPGPWRAVQTLHFWDGGEAVPTTMRDGIPGEDYWRYVQEGLAPTSAPRPLSREVVLAGADDGAWLSTADRYEIELVDWSGRTKSLIRWSGPDLAVTAADIEARRDRYFGYNLARRDDEAWRKVVEDGWAAELSRLPEVFPSVRRMLVPRDGGVWVQHYYRTGDPHITWVHFDDGGNWARTLNLPTGRRIMDIGKDWVLVRIRDAVGREQLFVHELVER